MVGNKTDALLKRIWAFGKYDPAIDYNVTCPRNTELGNQKAIRPLKEQLKSNKGYNNVY